MAFFPGLWFLPLVMTAACSTYPKVPAKGQLLFYPIETSVDSKIASYYLSHYPDGSARDDDMHQRISSLESKYQDLTLSHKVLRRLSEESSVDFAALYFARRLLSQEKNAKIQQKFLHHLENLDRAALPPDHHKYLVVLVPGLDYVEGGKATGADLAAPGRIIRGRGLKTRFVPLNPMGAVDENAKMLTETLEAHPDPSRFIIVGPSSAGPAIHLSLGKLLKQATLKRVRAWVNLGGILNGTPLVDWLDSGLTIPLFAAVRWYRGWKKETFDSMKSSVRRSVFPELKTPKSVFILNYLGLSLSGNISPFGRDKYDILRQYGPNDALTLLADSIAPGSVTIIAPESDHFFADDPRINQKTLALLFTVMDSVSEP